MRVWSEEAIEEARESFPKFLYIVWITIGLPAPTPIQLNIAEYIQNGKHGRRRIIQAFRGIGKSFITCAFVVWCLWKNRNLRVLIVSASGDRADANARFIKKIIQSVHFLREMLPDKDQLDTQNIFEVHGALPDASPSIKSVGITGQITGTRADILIPDDVEIPKNSFTQAQRDKLGELVKEFDAVLKPNGIILYLGTPQCEASLYNVLLDRGYNTRIWTVEVPSSSTIGDYKDRLAPMIQRMYQQGRWGEPTDPDRFNKAEIEERKISYGKAGFQLQFMLNTALSDFEKYPLKCSDFIVSRLDPKETSVNWAWSGDPKNILNDIPCIGLRGDAFYAPHSRSEGVAEYTGSAMFIDGSGRGSDETAWAIVKFIRGYLAIVEVDGVKDGYTDRTMVMLAQRAHFWDVNTVQVESNFGDGMFTKLLEPIFVKIHPCAIEEVRNNQMKEARIIDTLEPIMMAHKLLITPEVLENDLRVAGIDQRYSFIYQLTRLCREHNALAHDDRLDAVAGAVKYWIDCMNTIVEEENVEDNMRFLEEAMTTGVLQKYRDRYEAPIGNCVSNMSALRNGYRRN